MPVTERGRTAAQLHRQRSRIPAPDPGAQIAPAVSAGDAQRAQGYAHKARSRPRVMRASGVRIDVSNPESLKSLVSSRQSSSWQSLAWGYRDMIGELRYALQFRARAISRIQFFAAMIVPDDDEPLPLSLRNDDDAERAARITLPPDICQAAEEELARLPLDGGYGFLGIWSENFDVAGECYLHGFYDEFGDEQWKIRSIEEIEYSADGRTVYLREDAAAGMLGRKIDMSEEGGEELYRLWVPHPRRSTRADSSLHAMLGTMEDICLITRELRAVRRSRIMSNGVLLVPEGMTLMRNVREDADGEEEDDAFAADFTDAMNAPIANEGDPGGTVPVMVTGNIEDIEAFRHVKLERTPDPELMEQLTTVLGRLANGLDIPPELLQGMGEVNHWTAWQIDSATARHHIEPGARLMVDSITVAFLRMALLKRGFPMEQVRQVRAWYDMGSLTENPNRRQDAIDARKEGAISNDAFRRALGFNDGDAPTPQEIIEMVALKAGFDQATAAAFLSFIAAQDPEQPFELPAGWSAPAVGKAPAQLPAPRAAESEPAPAGPGDGPGGPPSTAPSAIAADGRGSALTAGTGGNGVSGTDLSIIHNGLTAAADPADYRLALDDSRRLMEIDRALRAQLITAANAAIGRALEVANARLRGKATADRELSLSLKGMDVMVIGRRIGRDGALALNADDDHLLRDAFANLATLFAKWTLGAIENIATRVLKTLGLDADSRAGRAAAKRMREDMGSRVDDGWNRLHTQLLERTTKLLFDGEDDTDLPGEVPEGLVAPYMIRSALAIVGGLPETSGGLDEYGRSLTGEPVGGLANGDTVRREMEDHGAEELGYLWVYGITVDPSKFEPHWDLEAERFATWTDPKLETATVYGGRFMWVGDHFRPGDHHGCMCDYVPAYAVPAYAEQVRERLAVPTKAMAEIIGLAEGDDKAGRTGTTAQALRDQHQQIQTLQARFLKGA